MNVEITCFRRILGRLQSKTIPTELLTDLPTELLSDLLAELVTGLLTELVTKLLAELVTELLTELVTELPTDFIMTILYITVVLETRRLCILVYYLSHNICEGKHRFYVNSIHINDISEFDWILLFSANGLFSPTKTWSNLSFYDFTGHNGFNPTDELSFFI